MRQIRIFTPEHLATGEEIAITGQAFQHLAKVLRAQPGQDVVLFNGEGGEFHGKLLEVRKREAILQLDRFDPVERETRVSLELVQGISRNERMDYTIQKAVELGISKIQPVLTRRSVVRLDGERAARRSEHWRGVIISACEQCGRNSLPELLPIVTFAEFLEQSRQSHAASPEVAAQGLILDPDGDTGIREIKEPYGSIRLLVGPEGGLDDSEIAAAVDTGFQRLRLGRRILRTETAAVVAAAALFTHWGEFD